MRNVKIACVQMPGYREGTTNAEKHAGNLRLAAEWLEKAGQKGADIACLGEILNANGLEITAQNFRQELEGSPEAVQDIAGRAAKKYSMYVIAPVWGVFDGVIRNAAMLMGRDGKYIGAYFKVHPTRGEMVVGVVAGDSWPVFQLDFGTVGIQICHDASFAESSRCLMLNGAEIIFSPHVMHGWGGEYMSILFRAPAIYNGVYFAPVSFGCQPGTAWRPGMMVGYSSVVGPDGLVLANAGRYPGVALAEVDLDQPRIAHDFTYDGEHVWQTDMLNDRRPDTYTPISRPK
jgi:predicted amidohydrolase